MKALISCPACRSSNTLPVVQLDDDRRERLLQFSEIKYQGVLNDWIDIVVPIVRQCLLCKHCWYQFQPTTDQLAEMYKLGRPINRQKMASQKPSKEMNEEMRRLYRLTAKRNSAINFLDYGSGSGRWSKAAYSAGFNVTSFEPSKTRSGNFSKVELVHSLSSLKGRTFDVIQLEQVLEHLPDPFNALRSLRGMCHENTVLRITVPNLLRDPNRPHVWEKWPFDGRTPHIMAPFEHLHCFTPKSLDSLLWRAGFNSIPAKLELRFYSINYMRRVIGRLFPSVGSTLRLARIGKNALD